MENEAHNTEEETEAHGGERICPSGFLLDSNPGVPRFSVCLLLLSSSLLQMGEHDPKRTKDLCRVTE